MDTLGGRPQYVLTYSTYITQLWLLVSLKAPPSRSFFSPFYCTPVGILYLFILNWGHQTLLRPSFSSQDIFQTPNQMTLAIRKHFGTWLFSHTTWFSSHSPEKWFPYMFRNQLPNTLGSSAHLRLTASENKFTHCSTSWFLVLGDMFVLSWSFLLACLNISKRIMTQSPTYWYKTEAFWLGKYTNISLFQPSVSFISCYIDYPAWRMKPELKRYYLMQFAYWCQQMLILVLGVEKPRKDHWKLIAHHFVTLWLIGWVQSVKSCVSSSTNNS